MGTLTITAAGFSNLGATAPSNWPSNVAFPANNSPNGTQVYTVDDADWLSLITWMASQQQAQIQGITGAPAAGQPLTPTAAQILLAWLNIWINGTKVAVQQFETVPAVVPAPISIQ